MHGIAGSVHTLKIFIETACLLHFKIVNGPKDFENIRKHVSKFCIFIPNLVKFWNVLSYLEF